MARHKEGRENSEQQLGTEKLQLTESEKKEKVEKAIDRAKDLRKNGEYNEGIDKLVDALKFGVEKDRIYYRLGNVYFDADDLDRAEYSYKRAIEENDTHVNAQHNLSVVYRKQGRVGKSIKQRKKAQKIEIKNPKNPELSDEEAKYAKRFAVKMILWIIGGIAAIGLTIYLVTRFLF